MENKKVVVVKTNTSWNRESWLSEDASSRRTEVQKSLESAYGKDKVEVIFLPLSWSLETVAP